MDSTPLIPIAVLQAATVWPVRANAAPMPRPLMGTHIAAGFPSPAADYVERELDIAALLITNPPATFFVRIEGQSMSGCWIRPGDIAIVDCSLDAKPGMVVIAVLDGELAVKEFSRGPNGEVLLIPRNARYKTITVREGQDFHVWGVVTWTVHRQLP